MSWPTNIPKIVDGQTPFNASSINPIIEALEQRTTMLKNSISNDSIISGVSFTDIGFDGCLKGQFVAYDTTLQKYIPASAIVGATKGKFADQLPADSSYVIGLLITDVVDSLATVLTSGIIRGRDIVDIILNDNGHIPGTYYLTTEGQVTANTDKVTYPIKCGTLTASGCFAVDIQIPDFRTHTHHCYTMVYEAWCSCTNPPIEGAKYYYNSELDTRIGYFLDMYASGLCLVVDNKVYIEDADYVIYNKNIYFKHAIKPNCVSVLYMTQPFSGLKGWLKTLATTETNNVLKITQSGDTAIIDIDVKEQEVKGYGKAIARLTNKGTEVTSVVNEVVEGPGISVTEVVPGTFKITSTATVSDDLELNILNANGIVFGGDDVVLIKFPANRSSELVGTVKVPTYFGKGIAANVFLWVEGNASSTAIGSAKIKPVAYSNVEEDGTVIKPTTPIQASIPSKNTPDSTRMYKLVSDTFRVDGGDLLNITVSFTPVIALNVGSIGVQLSYN
jgi:hypothetical protein